MFNYFKRIWHSKSLRSKILYTLFIIVVYRLAAHITVPSVDPTSLRNMLANSQSGTGQALGFINALLGGSMDNFSIILMGLSPYINASIIVQLLTVVVPSLESLSKEGEQGRNKINRITRWLSLPLAFVQSYGMILLLNKFSAGGVALIPKTDIISLLPIMLTVTAGTVFLVWLGEILTEKGIGNGISMIIFIGIVSNIPNMLGSIVLQGLNDPQKWLSLAILLVVTVLLTMFVVWFTDGNRHIPITYASRNTRGSSEKSALPIRVNQAGMVPIIFAVSLTTFPSIMAGLLNQAQTPWLKSVAEWINLYFSPSNPNFLYVGVYFLLVMAFSYFYVSITFNTDQVAENIQKRGGFIPGIRPGPETSRFLRKVSNNLNLWGGLFLGFVAIFPYLFNYVTSEAGTGSVPILISGAGLIIIVGVVMEIISRINAELVMHDYDKLY